MKEPTRLLEDGQIPGAAARCAACTRATRAESGGVVLGGARVERSSARDTDRRCAEPELRDHDDRAGRTRRNDGRHRAYARALIAYTNRTNGFAGGAGSGASATAVD